MEASMSISRRFFLGGVAASLALSGRALAGDAEDIDPRAAEIMAKTVAVDLHSHAGGRIRNMLPSRMTAHEYNVGEKMREGRFGVSSFAVIADNPVLKRSGWRVSASREPADEELFNFVTRGLALLERMREEYGLIKVLSPADVELAKSSGKSGMIFAIEGGDFINGKPERVEWAHGLGLRHLQLVHYRINDLGDIQTEEPRHLGLSKLGETVVAECNRLGIIIDVAHATKAMTERVAGLSKTPILLSHVNVPAPSGPKPLSRMISADHAKMVAATGGVIGVWPSGAAFSNLEEYAQGLARMVEIVGVDHVGIGSDMDGGIDEVFHSYADYPRLLSAMLRSGFSVDDAAKVVGGNHARVFAKVTAAVAK
jgi:membrane dipeptidase